MTDNNAGALPRQPDDADMAEWSAFRRNFDRLGPRVALRRKRLRSASRRKHKVYLRRARVPTGRSYLSLLKALHTLATPPRVRWFSLEDTTR